MRSVPNTTTRIRTSGAFLVDGDLRSAGVFPDAGEVEPVFKYLRSRRRMLSRDQLKKLEEQAARIAWRQLLRWVEVQISLIDIGMVEYSQVFLAYRQEGEGGRTVWDIFQEQQFKALEAGPKQ